MLYIGLCIWVILFSWVIIIWSIVEHIRRKREEKEFMLYMYRKMEVDRKLESIWKYGIIIEEKE